MGNRTCTVDGCSRAHQARGLCSTHYCAQHRQTFGRKMHAKVCAGCGDTWLTTTPTSRYCSQFCSVFDRLGPQLCPLPKRHPAMRAKLESKTPKPKRKSTYAWRTSRECPGCACMFTPLYTPNAITCSKRCARRVHRWRRKAAERNAVGSWVWSDFMRIAQRFDFHCAYCGDKPTGQLDPDHVVPLSKGGYNSTANLLPSCRPCNADKRDLLLDEWNADRERRGLAPRTTTWAPDDRRFRHLTQTLLTSSAAA